MDGPSINLESLIHSAFDDVVRALDSAEYNLRNLAVNPYVPARSEPTAIRSEATTIPMMEGPAPIVQDSPPPDVHIPHRCVVSEEYKSRPKLHLDWILTTDPSKVQKAEPSMQVRKVDGIPESEWILDTKRAGHRSRQPRAQPQPPLVTKNRQKMDMEWIFSTNTSQPNEVRIVKPEVQSQKVSGSEWIFKTTPDSHGPSEVHDPMQSLEETKRLRSFVEEENLIRTGNVRSDGRLDDLERYFLKTARAASVVPAVPPAGQASTIANAGVESERQATDRGPLLASPVAKNALEGKLLNIATSGQLNTVGHQRDLETQLRTARGPGKTPPNSKDDSSDLKTARELEVSPKVDSESAQLKTARGPEVTPAIPMDAAAAEIKKIGAGPAQRAKKSFLNEANEDLDSSDFVSPTSTPSTVATAKQPSPPRYSSYFDLHKGMHPKPHSKNKSKAQAPSSQPKAKAIKASSNRNPRRARVFRSDVSLRTAVKARSAARIRLKAKAAYLKARRKKRMMLGHRRVDHTSMVTPTERLDADDHLIHLEPLKAPISIDSKRTISRTGEQTNLRQVLRIYGSGSIEEPYDELPRRSSTKFVRGALASVKYGTNMIEIALQNTAVQAARRGQASNWIFTHNKDVHTVPLVFCKTALVNKHAPAPFCLSMPAPFWVNAFQQQTASRKGGERLRESIEIRSCTDSGVPCYEMRPLVEETHPLFNERIYIGRGIIRIDRDVRVPDEQELRESFSNYVNKAVNRQYRIQLPWRQIPGRPDPGIPRAPQITDIRTTVRADAIHPQKRFKDDSQVTGLNKPRGKKFRVRRRLPPLSSDTTGTIRSLSCEQDYQPEGLQAVKVTSSTFAVVPSVQPDIRESVIHVSDHAASRNVFLPRSGKMKPSSSVAGSGVLNSSRENSPVHTSDRDVMGPRKNSDLPVRRARRRVSRLTGKEPPILKPPAKLSTAKEAESMECSAKTSELLKNDGKLIPVDTTQKSDVESAQEGTRDKAAQTSETAGPSIGTSGASTIPDGVFEYAKDSDQPQSDRITAEALTPVMLCIREVKGRPLRKTPSVCYSYRTPTKTGRSRETSRSRNSRSKVSRSKEKSRKSKERAVVDAVADNFATATNNDIVIHEKLADGTMKLQLHFSSRLKEADQKADVSRFQPHKITVYGQDVWSNQ